MLGTVRHTTQHQACGWCVARTVPAAAAAPSNDHAPVERLGAAAVGQPDVGPAAATTTAKCTLAAVAAAAISTGCETANRGGEWGKRAG